VGVSHKGVEVAGGIYMPGPEELLAIRTWLATHHASFLKTARGPEKLMGKLYGESLRRVPKGFRAEHPAADLLKMKQWLYYAVWTPAWPPRPSWSPKSPGVSARWRRWSKCSTRPLSPRAFALLLARKRSRRPYN